MPRIVKHKPRTFTLDLFGEAGRLKLCQYIKGDWRAGPATICAAPCKADSAYCVDHARLCYTAAPKINPNKLPKI